MPDKPGPLSMEDNLIRKNLDGTGHLMRMTNGRLPIQISFSLLPNGHRTRWQATSLVQKFYQGKLKTEADQPGFLGRAVTAKKSIEAITEPA